MRGKPQRDSPDHVTLGWRKSIQPDAMDVGVERKFSPQNFSMFLWE